MKVINLISGPRNISTALMYSFAQRADCVVLDEPFYANYLQNATLAIDHPSRKEILDSLEIEEDEIIRSIESKTKDHHVFIKGMAHHILSEKPRFLLGWENIILIRDPKKLIVSFSKVIEYPTLNDIGIKKTSELFDFLKNRGRTPWVIDSDELMLDPKKYLQKICVALQIDFSEKMLSWPKGGIPEDGVWAKHWYKNVHDTTGFKIQQKAETEVPERLISLYEEAQPYYENLKNYILKND